jgi:hypothetical protein
MRRHVSKYNCRHFSSPLAHRRHQSHLITIAAEKRSTTRNFSQFKRNVFQNKISMLSTQFVSTCHTKKEKVNKSQHRARQTVTDPAPKRKTFASLHALASPPLLCRLKSAIKISTTARRARAMTTRQPAKKSKNSRHNRARKFFRSGDVFSLAVMCARSIPGA